MAGTEQLNVDMRSTSQITPKLLAFLNQYPDLLEYEKIVFGDGSQESGIAMYPISGAVVITEEEDITGVHTQECQYPFYLIYKVGTDSGSNRISIKEFLDALGLWAEQQDYSFFDGLVDGLTVTEISRQTPAYLDSREANNVENWAIYLPLYYTRTWEE